MAESRNLFIHYKTVEATDPSGQLGSEKIICVGWLHRKKENIEGDSKKTREGFYMDRILIIKLQ